MENVLIPAAVAVLVFIIFFVLIPERVSSDTERRKRAVLGQVSQDSLRSSLDQGGGSVNVLKYAPAENGIFSRFPGAQSTVDLLLKAGLWEKRSVFLLSSLFVFLVFCLILRNFAIVGIVISLVLAYVLPRKYLKNRIAKRNAQFQALFPDAVDMIVRSVRSGHPLNTALRMIVDNIGNPVREEFKQVVDEIAYGRTLTEALARMATRIDEPDVNFFVVVLSVQQETGGSLAEVLSNLSSIIRKRRQLRIKIRTLTSEGRTTSYILGGLPVLEFMALYFITPSYIGTFFNSLSGNIMLGIACGLIFLAIWISRVMSQIDI